MNLISIDANSLQAAYTLHQTASVITASHLAKRLKIKESEASSILRAWEQKTSYEEQNLRLFAYKKRVSIQ
jgi:ribosomal protein S25